MKVSIITVCYNSESTIRDTIESVLQQNHPDIEYIIVDGKSTDNTVSIIREYENKIKTIISEPDKGIYDAMNKGLQAAIGDVIGILNSDDFYENSNVISEVISQFESDADLSVVFGNVVFVDPYNIEITTRFYDSRKFKAWKLRFGWMPPHTASFIKRSAYEEVGNYSLEYKIAADFDLFVRLLMVHKLSYININKVLVRMRSGGVSTSGLRATILLIAEDVKACKINGIYTNLFFILSKLPFKLIELLKRPKDVS